MKMKKIISMIMAGAMLAGSLSASALYSENVPLVDNPRKIAGTGYFGGSGTLDTSAPSTLFTVGGQTFALLDTDEEGNYFVVAEKYFGTHPYWEGELMDRTLSKAIDNGDGTYDFFWQKPEDIDMDKVCWNPQQEGTVAYWLNNDFLNGANLPDEIKNNIVEHEWQNEAIDTNPNGTDWGGEYAIRRIFADEGADDVGASGQANLLAQYGYGGVYSHIVNKISVPAYTTTSKLALLSVSELKAYADKVGIRPPVGGWQGMMSRTITSYNTTTKQNGAYLPQNTLYVGPVQVYGVDNATDATKLQILSIDGGALPTKNYYYIRPVFWLDKDFFKNEKIDLATAGADPLAEVKKYNYHELALAGYTDEEINTFLAIEPPKAISNVTITSNDAIVDNITQVNSVKISAVFADSNADKVMIVAIYDGSELLSVGIANTAEQEGKTKTVEISGFSGASKCKFFVWDSLEGMKPEFMAEWGNEFSISIEGIYDSSKNKILKPDEITDNEGINVNIEYDNRNYEGKSINCNVQFSDAEGNIIDNSFKKIEIPGFEKSQKFVVFETPEEFENVSGITITLTDGLTLQEICESYFMCDGDWKASGVLTEESADNLVTTFYGDEGTTRGFAWVADVEHTDMAIRYASATDDWYEESIVKDATYTEYEGKLHYKVDIDMLTPGESYVYKIGDKQDDLWSEEYSFKTEPDDLTEFSFLGVADPQSHSWAGGFEYYKNTLDAAFETDSEISFMVNLGDMIENGTIYSEWECYFDAVEGYAESIPHMAVVGNHETRGTAETAVKYYTLLFNNPQNGKDALGTLTVDGVGINGKGVVNNFKGTVYSFDYGNAHFAVLNSGSDWSETDTRTILQKQAEWLREDLDNSDKKWKIVMVHQGMYPAKTERYNTKAALLEVIDECGVDLVLQGHDHMVARTYPMMNDNIVSSENTNSITKDIGTVYTILGVAGPKRYDSVSEVPEYMTVLVNTNKTKPTYSLFTVNESKISVVTKTVDGTVVDEYEIVDNK